jgi:hypothetical protein
MKNLSTLNSQLSTIAFIFAVNISHALDPMYNYRYTLGPEILVPDAFHGSAGFFTHLNADGVGSLNFQLGLADEFEIGAKYMLGTDDKWIISEGRHNERFNHHTVDVGFKYAITRHVSLQVDVPLSLNEDREWGGVLSVSSWSGYTRNISFIYEGRLGFLGASGPDNHVKLSGAFVPYVHIGDAFRLSVCTVGSFSVQNFEKDAMLDMMPRIEAGFTSFRLMGEASIGILTWKTEKYNRYSAFAIFDI